MIEIQKKHYFMTYLTFAQKDVIVTLSDYINRGG